MGFMRRGYPIYKGEEGGLLPQMKGMLFLSSIGHIILFVLVVYISLSYHQNRVKPIVYNVNLVEFIGERGAKKTATKTIEEPIKKISPPPAVKEKPKVIKKQEPKKTKPPKKEEKKVKKSPVAVAKKKEAKPAKTSSQKNNGNPSSVIASRENKVNLGGSYRGSLSLDNANFPFMYYLVLIRDKISENWNPDFVTQPLTEGQQVVIAFKIQKDGGISSPYIEKTSGIAYLDQSALRAVLSSVPFPPLPKEFGEEYLGIHFGFEYIKKG
jgi:TonB family protein